MKQSESIKLNDLNIKYLQENNFKYALIYYLNDIVVDKIDNLDNINKDLIYEAMFFNENKELYFFEDNGYIGILTEKEDSDKEVSYKSIEVNHKDNKKIKYSENIVDSGNIIYEEFLLKERLGCNLRKNKYESIKVANYIDFINEDEEAYIKATCLCELLERGV